MEAREYVKEMFETMPVEQLVKVFNEYVTDSHAFRFPCIYEMDDEETDNIKTVGDAIEYIRQNS